MFLWGFDADVCWFSWLQLPTKTNIRRWLLNRKWFVDSRPFNPNLHLRTFRAKCLTPFGSPTPYATSFRRRVFAHHHGLNHPHKNIILSWLRIPLVLKCAAKILKIGLQIKMYRPNMFLNRDFCMVKLQRKSPFSREKIKVLKFYLKIIKPTPNYKKSLPGVQTFD